MVGRPLTPPPHPKSVSPGSYHGVMPVEPTVILIGLTSSASLRTSNAEIKVGRLEPFGGCYSLATCVVFCFRASSVPFGHPLFDVVDHGDQLLVVDKTTKAGIINGWPPLLSLHLFTSLTFPTLISGTIAAGLPWPLAFRSRNRGLGTNRHEVDVHLDAKAFGGGDRGGL